MPLSLKSISRSLAHRNYRLFFLGQLVSLIGTWITSIATSWLVYRLTGSTVILATLNAVNMLPSLLITPYAGVHVDRWDRRKVLLATQALSLLQSLALALLTLFGLITVPQLFVLVAVQGIVNAFDMPARQAFVSDIIESPTDLANAIALNSAMFNGARLIGPGIGGLLIAAAGEGACFMIDAVSYLAVLVGLTKIRLAAFPRPKAKRSALDELKEGVRYVLGFEPIAALIAVVATVSFAAAPYMVLLTPFVREELHGGPEALGELMAASGLGALFAALYLASRSTVLGLGRLICSAGMCLAIGLALLSVAPNVWIALPIVAAIGLAMILVVASCNTILQTLVDPQKRGRVMSLFSTAFMGIMPIGGIVAGWSASLVGLRVTIALGGAIVLVMVGVFSRRLPRLVEQVRPIYAERGILRT